LKTLWATKEGTSYVVPVKRENEKILYFVKIVRELVPDVEI